MVQWGTLDRFENFKFKIIWPPIVQNWNPCLIFVSSSPMFLIYQFRCGSGILPFCITKIGLPVFHKNPPKKVWSVESFDGPHLNQLRQPKLQAVGRPLEPHGWRCNTCSSAHTLLLFQLEQWPVKNPGTKHDKTLRLGNFEANRSAKSLTTMEWSSYITQSWTPRIEKSKLKWVELSQLCFRDVGDQLFWSTWISKCLRMGCWSQDSSHRVFWIQIFRREGPCTTNQQTNHVGNLKNDTSFTRTAFSASSRSFTWRPRGPLPTTANRVALVWRPA